MDSAPANNDLPPANDAAALARADADVQRLLELAAATMTALASSDAAGATSAAASAVEFVSVVESIHKTVAEAITTQDRGTSKIHSS